MKVRRGFVSNSSSSSYVVVIPDELELDENQIDVQGLLESLEHNHNEDGTPDFIKKFKSAVKSLKSSRGYVSEYDNGGGIFNACVDFFAHMGLIVADTDTGGGGEGCIESIPIKKIENVVLSYKKAKAGHLPQIEKEDRLMPPRPVDMQMNTVNSLVGNSQSQQSNPKPSIYPPFPPFPHLYGAEIINED